MATMETFEAANATKEVKRLDQEHYYHSILSRYVAEHRVHDITDEVYIKKWYEVYRGIFKSMSWPHTGQLSTEMDETILNAWHCTEVNLDNKGWNIATTFIFKRLTSSKPNTTTPKGRTAFNNFTTTYNCFCTEQNFNLTEGFNEIHDAFFKFFSSNTTLPKLATMAPPTAQTTKSVRFTSAPPIDTLPNLPSSSPEEFPTLQASTKAPISYASATSAFILVTRRRQNKPDVNKLITPMTQTPTKPTATQTGPKPGPKSLCQQKPPLSDALKTTKHMIILDHTDPETKSKYSMDAGEITHGLQHHLETVKAPLVLLAGAWSTTPFYKNFILTFSSIVNYTDITKYDSVLFRPFGKNCCAAPTAGYQSILISGIHLQCDATGKLASPKMLFDELCRNPVFVS